MKLHSFINKIILMVFLLVLSNRPVAAQEWDSNNYFKVNLFIWGGGIILGGIILIADQMSKNLEQENGLKNCFYFPEKIEFDDIEKSVNFLGKNLKGSSRPPSPPTSADSEWRNSVLYHRGAVRSKKTVIHNASEWDFSQKRDMYCQSIEENFLKKTYCGAQFGLCQEGSAINYCLAHKAGIRKILECFTDNDHQLTIFQHPEKNTICAMDRWDRGAGHYFCDIEIKDGNLIHPKISTTDRWFQGLKCGDPIVSPFHEYNFTNISAKHWPKF